MENHNNGKINKSFETREIFENGGSTINMKEKYSNIISSERKRFLDVLETLPVYIILINKDYYVPFENKYFRERFGKSNGKRCYEYLFNRNQPCDNCETFITLKTNKSHFWEWTGPDGRDYEVFDYPFVDADGSTLILEMGIDVTEKKEMGIELKESEEKYRTLFHSARDAIYILNVLNGKIVDANKSACELYGYSREEFLEKTIYDISAEIKETLQAIKENVRWVPERYHRKKDGTIFPVEVSISVIDKNGEKLHRVHVHDITERKKMQEILEKNEKEFRTLFEILPVSVTVVDINRHIKKSNPAAYKILEIPEEKIKNNIHFKRKYIRKDFSEMQENDFPSVISIRENRIVKDVEIGVIKEDGNIIWLSVSATPIGNEEAVVVSVDITDRIKAEKIIRNSEANLNEAQKLAKIGSYHFNFKTGKITWSDEMFRVFGIDKKSGEPSYEELSKYYTEESWKLHNQVVEKALKFKEPYNVEFEFIKGKNGKKGWLNVIGKINLDADGKVIELFGTAQDVTERKLAHKELERLNSEILDLYNNAPCGYHSIDENSVLININDTELKWFGYSREEIINKVKITDLMTEESRTIFRNNFANFMKTGYIDNLEFEFIRKNGSIFFVNLNSTAVYDENGKFRYTRSSMFDITSRKEAEKKFEKSSKIWNDTFNAIKDHIWILDKNGTIIQSNKSSEDVFCFTCENAIGKKCYEIMHDAKTYLKNCPFTAMSNSRKREVSEHVKNGKVYSVTVDPIFDEKGEYFGAVHIMSDITKLKKAEIQLRDFTKHLQNAREEERTTLSRTLHDNFGQQLTGLKMEISTFEKKIGNLFDIKIHPEISEKFKSMKSMLDDSIALTSRISMDLRPNVLDMLGLIPAIEWLSRDFMEKSELKINVENNAQTMKLNPAFSTEVFRIIQEALINIVRHAEATEVNIKIKSDQDTYEISVSDNGRGIKEDEKKSPYSLGLMGMRERAIIFKGEIEIKGVKNKGTKLTIKIPKFDI